jgi:hypothetical protein
LSKSEATKYKFIPANKENPTDFIVQVTNVSANGQIVIKQPAIDNVFKQFNIKAEKVLTPSNLVDIDLEQGVTLNAAGQQTSSFAEWKQLINRQPSFLNENKPLTFSINYLWKKTDKAKLKIVGDIKITSDKADVNVKKNWLGLIKAFDYSFQSTQDSNVKFLLEANGKIVPKSETKKFESDWLTIEEINREGRISLATLTYQIGTAPIYGLGNRGYIQVPIGITVFLTVNAKGEAKISMQAGLIEKSTLNVDVKWKDKDFDSNFDLDTSRYLLNFEGTGELQSSLGMGLEPALNIGGLLPAVVQNDLSADYNLKGDIKAQL